MKITERRHIMKHLQTAALLLTALCLTGCGSDRYALPENPVIFEEGTFVNPDDPEDICGTREWDGRTYLMFGTEKGWTTHFGPCLGYVEGDENERIFAAEGLPEEEYLIEYYVAGEMIQAFYLRCIDTRGDPVPEQLESYGYPFWENQPDA